MELRIEVDDNLISDFTDDAKNELSRQAIKLTNHLIEEALVWESGRRDDEGDKPEITVADVKSAAKRKKPSQKKKKWPLAVQSLSPIIIFFIGKYWDTYKDFCIIVLIGVVLSLFYSLITTQHE